MAIIFLLAFLSGAERPPSRSTNLLISVVAVSCQFAAGLVFSGSGRANPAHVQASTRRMAAFARQVAVSRQLAETSYEQDAPKISAAQYRSRMGILSSALSRYEEDALGFIDDWRLVNKAAVDQAIEQTSEQSGG
ncbi:hypothetical protein AB0M13_26005 [Nocardia fluminea]|uniref:hypothetical protein n=1 Tax=Nocardia fluminea TaxID=134984 RepID=UPI0034270DBE